MPPWRRSLETVAVNRGVNVRLFRDVASGGDHGYRWRCRDIHRLLLHPVLGGAADCHPRSVAKPRATIAKRQRRSGDRSLLL